ncbi:MAG: hypothetical protein WBF29_06585, partial [Syntrophobacteria bacterium]
MNHLLRPRIWPSFLASSGVPSTGSPRLRSPRLARDRRDRQDRLPLRRTVKVRLGFDVGFRICPSDSHPSGGFPVSDLGFLTTIDDIELNSLDFAIRFLVLRSFSVNFQSVFR